MHQLCQVPLGVRARWRTALGAGTKCAGASSDAPAQARVADLSAPTCERRLSCYGTAMRWPGRSGLRVRKRAAFLPSAISCRMLRWCRAAMRASVSPRRAV